MTEKSNKKTQILIAVLGGIFVIIASIISSPQWFKYFFPEQYLEQESLPNNKSKNVSINEESKENVTENLVIDKIQLLPRTSKLPSYLYIEIKNKGSKVLRNVTLNLDLGRASFKGIDIFGNNIANIDSSKVNELYVTYSVLKKNDSKAIYCLLSQPVFKSIKLSGSNLNFSKEYTYKAFILNDGKQESEFGFIVLLKILIGLILIIFAFFFVAMVYKFLRKKGLINLD